MPQQKEKRNDIGLSGPDMSAALARLLGAPRKKKKCQIVPAAAWHTLALEVAEETRAAHQTPADELECRARYEALDVKDFRSLLEHRAAARGITFDSHGQPVLLTNDHVRWAAEKLAAAEMRLSILRYKRIRLRGAKWYRP